MINEHSKFSTDLDPVTLFDTVQEAQMHERKLTARKFIQDRADQEFTLRVSDEFTNVFVDNLVADLAKLMGWEM